MDTYRLILSEPKADDCQNKTIIHNAYMRHCNEHHNADFELCSDPQCERAMELENDLYQRGVWMMGA